MGIRRRFPIGLDSLRLRLLGLHPPSDWLSYPGTKDVRQHPYGPYQGPLFRWSWKLWHFRLTRAGRWFFGLTSLTVFIFALYGTLETQTYLPATYACCLWLAALPAFFRRPKTTLHVRQTERLAAGETLRAQVDVRNDGRGTLYDLHLFPWGLPAAIDADAEEGTYLGTLPAGASATAVLSLYCRRRGVYTLPGFRVASDFPLGLTYAYALVPAARRLIVHPAFHPLARLNLPSGRRYQPGGLALSTPSGDSFEYLGNRPWREGDNPRDIDWRATARHGGTPNAPLVVREWREEYFLRVGVLLDTFQPKQGGWAERARRAETLERAIAVCAAVADALASQDYVVDLFAAGPDLYHLTVGRGIAYREQILDILACVDPSPTDPLPLLMSRLNEDLPRLTTLVCVLLTWDPPRQAFVQELRAQGVGVRTVVLVEHEDAGGTDPEVHWVTPTMVMQGRVAL